MKYFDRNKKLIKSAIVISLLVALLAIVTSCEGMGFPSTTPQETPQPEPPKVTSPASAISTRDAAKLAVYQHLLERADGYEAKVYLADFYASCDNWSAESEYFKDGSGTWHVVVDMTGNTEWALHPYWQLASWLVFKDGKVIPSNNFQANALRIEADLQSLSPAPEPEAD